MLTAPVTGPFGETVSQSEKSIVVLVVAVLGIFAVWYGQSQLDRPYRQGPTEETAGHERRTSAEPGPTVAEPAPEAPKP